MRNLLQLKKIKSILEKMFDPSKPKWIYICIFFLIFSGIITSFLSKKNTHLEQAPIIDTEISTDTYIPEGYALVPLEITNALTISSLMGKFTFVDIYTTGLDYQKKKIIAQNLRMVKAPNDDNQFAVLINETEHELIHNLSEPVFVVIKNRNNKKSEIKINKEQPLKNRKSRVSYGY
jgi:hypothetical protein